jgi:hypothetical protein
MKLRSRLGDSHRLRPLSSGRDTRRWTDAGTMVQIWHIEISIDNQRPMSTLDQSTGKPERRRCLPTATFATSDCEHTRGGRVFGYRD